MLINNYNSISVIFNNTIKANQRKKKNGWYPLIKAYLVKIAELETLEWYRI